MSDSEVVEFLELMKERYPEESDAYADISQTIHYIKR